MAKINQPQHSKLASDSALETAEGFISESQAILEYIERAHPQPSLWPAIPFGIAKVQELAQINLLLMLFNLLPIGPLDGHHIVATLLPPESRMRYLVANARYGTLLLLGSIIADFAGVPVFEQIMNLGRWMLPYITFVR